MGVLRALYTVQISYKYENVWKEIRWNNDYLILGLEGQYMGIKKNNTTHISSVEIHAGMVDMHTL